ncbi:MAG: group III truncated hemoglobin [Cyclobacteriaceae bacterium]|nr:group III truncated hemoglobin [Cyclobacteriaceae bacterium]
MKKDIESRADIELLVNQFYNKVNQDALLAPVFSHVDWLHHFPIMYNFWSSMLLGDQSYQGNPFQKHIHLAINPSHFNQWLALFTETVDENFAGFKADEVKSRAQSIAGVFQHKMGLLSL